MVSAVSSVTGSTRMTSLDPNPLSSMLSDAFTASTDVGKPPTSAVRAPSTVAARNATQISSRSLTTQEKQVVRTALENAKVRLERTELALQGNWLKRVPGSTQTNKEIFSQYFGKSTEAMRTEVFARVQRIRMKVDTMLSKDIGKSVVRSTGKMSDYSAYVDTKTQQIAIGSRFFTFRSPSSVNMNSQAGVLVHELSHITHHNGKRSVDEVPAYVGSGKGVYEEAGLKKLAQNNPELAIRNANLLMWYVERAK